MLPDKDGVVGRVEGETALRIQICLHIAAPLGKRPEYPVQGSVGFFPLLFFFHLPPLLFRLFCLRLRFAGNRLILGLLFKQIVKVIHDRLPLFRFWLLSGLGRLVPRSFLGRLFPGRSWFFVMRGLRLFLPLGLDFPKLLPHGRLFRPIRSTPCGAAAVL